jgi:hypothetical protein
MPFVPDKTSDSGSFVPDNAPAYVPLNAAGQPIAAAPDDGSTIGPDTRGVLDYTRQALQPLSDIVTKLGTVPRGFPQIPHIPDYAVPMPEQQIQAGIFNALSDVVNASPTPVGVALAGGGLPARLTGALLSPLMAQRAAEQLQPTIKTIQNPDVPVLQKAEAATGEALNALGTLAPLAGHIRSVYDRNTPLVQEAAAFGFSGPRTHLIANAQVLRAARKAGFTGQNISDLQDFVAKHNDAVGQFVAQQQAVETAMAQKAAQPQSQPRPVEPLPDPTNVPPTELKAVADARVQASAEKLAAEMVGSTPEEVRLRQLAVNLMGRTPEQAAKAIRAEIKLTEDPDRKAILTTEADRLDNLANEQNAIIEKQQAQQDAIEAQRKQQEDLLKAQHAVQMEQVKAAEDAQKAQQDALQQQQAGLEAQQKQQQETDKLSQALQPKPQVLANAGAEIAKNIEDQPATAQAQLNQITQPAQPQAPALANPTGGPNNAVQIQGPEQGLLRPESPQPQNPLAVQGVGNANQLQDIAGTGEKEALIKATNKQPGVTYQYTVQRPLVPGGKGFIQIDAIAGGKNIFSSNLEDMAKAGVKLSKVPDWIPQGQYTAQQLRKLIKQGPPKTANQVAPAEAEMVLSLHDPEKLDYLREQLAAQELSPEDYRQRVKESADVFVPGKTSGSAIQSMASTSNPWEQWRRLDDSMAKLGFFTVGDISPHAISPREYYAVEYRDNIYHEKNGEIYKTQDYNEDGVPSTDTPPLVDEFFAVKRKAMDHPTTVVAKEEPAPPKPESKGTRRKSANVGRIVKMMGDKLYSADVSKTTGKELFQNALDAAMRTPGAKAIYSGYDSGQFTIGDNGPGMTPDIILDKFLPAGESGKSVGSAGGLGLAKIAILGGNKEWTVTTVARNPSGNGFIRSVLKGTGIAYHEYVSNPPDVTLHPDRDIELADGMTLNYTLLPEDELQSTGTVVQVATKDPYYSDRFVKDGGKYTRGVPIHQIYKPEFNEPDKSSLLGKMGYAIENTPAVEQPEYGVMHSIETPSGTIDFIAPKGGQNSLTEYHYYDVLNRGVLQFSTYIKFRDNTSLPTGFAINVKPKVAAEDALYPFTTNREELINSAKLEIERYLTNIANEQRKVMEARYENSLTGAPQMKHNPGLVFLDAGGSISPELSSEIVNSRAVASLANDVADIQNGILKTLQRKYPGEGFGKAKFRGLLTGGRAYGVHFGKPEAKETGIYHDIFLTWRDAADEALSYLQHEADVSKDSRKAMGIPSTYDDAVRADEEMRKLLPEATYQFFRAKIAGIALHEALHQVIHTEGEDLARGLTFKAGDILEPILALTEQERTPEQYADINEKIINFGTRLAEQKSVDAASDFIVSQGGYSGYALRDAGPNAPAVGKAEATVATQPGSSLESQPPFPPGTRYTGAAGEAPPPDNKEARRQASARRQQRGATASDVLSSTGGAAAGFTAGFLTADPRRKDETEEEYQLRRLTRAVILGFGGGIMGYSANKVFVRPSVGRSRALAAIKAEAVGTENMPAWYLQARQSPVMVKLRESINNTRVVVKDLVANAALNGNIITDDINPYAKGKTYGGRLSEAGRQIEKQMADIQGVVIDTAKAAKIPPQDFIIRLNAWLEAGHTPAYNAFLADKWQQAGNTGPAPTGRLTDAEAVAIRQQARADGLEPAFQNIGKLYNGVRDTIRDVMVNGGLITPETRQVWEQKFPEWVPFNRVLDTANIDDAIIGHISGGPGLSSLSSGVRHYGENGTDLPISDIAGNLLANWKDAVGRVMKSELQLSAANFFRMLETAGTPVPGVEVRRPKVIGSSGSHPILENFNPEHMVSYMKDGKPTWIVFEDPRMAQAFGSTNSENVNALLRFIGHGTRLLSRAYTQYNLNWLLPNVVRDKQSAAWKAISQGDYAGAFQQLNPTQAPTDMKAVVDWIMERPTTHAQRFQSMLDNGGLSGGFATSTRAKAHTIIEDMRRADTNPASWTKQKFIQLFQLMSEVSEGSTRLRAYERALSVGTTPQEAAVAALNSSVDFNQRGTLSPQLSKLWAFTNPSIQGGINAAKNLIRNKHAAVLLAGAITSLGLMVDQWNKSMLPNWKQVPALSNARTNGVPIIYGVDQTTGQAQYFMIPVSQELRAPKAAIDFMTDLGNGDINTKEEATNGAARVGAAVINMASPLPVSYAGPGATLAPTVLRPLLETAANKNYWGGPIVPPYMQEDSLLQEHAKYSPRTLDSRTGRMSVSVSKFLKDDLNVEVSPDKLRYILNGYLGGWANMGSSAINATKPAEAKASDIPGMGGFFKEASVGDVPSPLQTTTQDIAERTHSQQVEHTTQQKALFNQTFGKVPTSQWGKLWVAIHQPNMPPLSKEDDQRLLKEMQAKALGTGQLDMFIKGIPAGDSRAQYYYWVIKDHFKDDLQEAQKFVNQQIAKKNLTGDTAKYLQAYLARSAPAQKP